jgi:hypothetical protein
MPEINEFNTGEVSHNPWDCEDPFCPVCAAAIDDFVAKLEEDKIDEDRL